MTFSVTAVVQLGSMLIAGVYLDAALKNRMDEIESYPIDEEVRELEETEEELNQIYAEVSKWETLPGLARLVLVCSCRFVRMAYCCSVLIK